MSFHVGQKVVCVDDSFSSQARDRHSAFPSRGQVYVIREISAAFTGAFENGRLCVHLEGISDDPYPHVPGHYFGFKAARFRPVIERKTDISIFTAMLTPNRVNA